MENQMDNLITASQIEYEAFIAELDVKIIDFINENNYTWSLEDIYKEFIEKYSKGFYVSYTCKKVIENFKDDLVKATGIRC